MYAPHESYLADYPDRTELFVDPESDEETEETEETQSESEIKSL
jgi:hypothetical protein